MRNLLGPYFFVENQQGLSNPHDRLDPTQALTYWRAMCAMDQTRGAVHPGRRRSAAHLRNTMGQRAC